MAKKSVQRKKVKIGIALFSQMIPFHRELKKGFLEEAKKRGDDLVTYSADHDLEKQAEQVRKLISQKVDVIVICPVDSMQIGKSIALANNADIPVFTADTKNMSNNGKVICAITSDNIQGGVLAARLMARAIRYEGRVVLLSHPGLTSCADRIEGFGTTIKEYPEITILRKLEILPLRQNIRKLMESILQGRERVKGIFAVSDEAALGALDAIQNVVTRIKVIIVGHDAIPEARKAIADGKIYADVRQHPIKIGHETIKIVHEYLEGLKVPPVHLVEVGTWT